MRLVVLDGYTLNPGDLTWDGLKSLAACVVYDRTAEDDLGERAAPAELLLTNKTRLDAAAIQSLPQLRYIGVLATGTNVVDLKAARERGIPVTNVPAYGTPSVAQATMALLLELTNAVGHHARTVREGRWSQQPDFCYWDQPLVELAGLTMGIVGLGRIGRAVARLASAFDMKVLATAPRVGLVPDYVRAVDLETLLGQSDVISLHCPLTPETRHVINLQRLSLMKPTALLLNTSRGQLLDEVAVAEALNSGRLGGAGLDVLSEEPPAASNPMLSARNCIVTPHCAWGTRAARARLMDVAVENVRAFLAGKPQNVVN